MSSIHFSNVSFAYADGPTLLRDVDLHFARGWTAVVGANGAGKSTLLRLVTGACRPDVGRVDIDPPNAVVVECPQTVDACTDAIRGFASDTSRLAYRLRDRLALDAEGLDRWPTLSPGERKRWQIGAALACEPDVLLVDEPTNHLDIEARTLLVDALTRFRGIGICVSHDRTLLAALVQGIVRVHAGSAVQYDADYDTARATWESAAEAARTKRREAVAHVKATRASLADTRRDHQGAVAQLSTRARMKGPRDADARNSLAKGLAEAAERRIGRDVGIARARVERAERELESHAIEREVGRDVFVAYQRAPKRQLAFVDMPEVVAGERVVLRDVQLTVSRDDRIWIAGPNGAGKSTLLDRLVDALPAESRIHLSQELSIVDARALLENVRALHPNARGRVLSLVAALGIDPDRLLASEQPSPGEARKLAIAFGLGTHAWVLALDEPTHHLDLPSLERLERMLTGFPGALLLVTHDERLARAVTTTKWVVNEGRVRIV